MTNITEELARLNALGKNGGGGYDKESLGCNAYAMLTLLNTMHGLLVQAEGAFSSFRFGTTEYGSRASIEYQGYNCVALWRDALTALRNAGIGGNRG